MKNTFIYCALMVAFSFPLRAEKNSYTCKFDSDIPYGVSAFSQSGRVRNGIGKESRFGPYPKISAAELASDVQMDRGDATEIISDPRETAFWQAYDEKGWYLYIESKEPLGESLLSSLFDPLSAGRREHFELFFAPGLKNVPYYQFSVAQYLNKTTYYDWGMPGMDYRSLEDDTCVESLPLEGGVGTFVFIPWHLLYEYAPWEGGVWRFTIVRFMPFAKAGITTWGGRVHELGRFGLVRFEKSSEAQCEAIQRRLLQYAWFKFQGISDQMRPFVSWNDEYVGDPEFYEKTLAPEIERLSAIGEKWGDPAQLSADELKAGMAQIKDFMEFNYRVSALRTKHLQQKLFSRK